MEQLTFEGGWLNPIAVPDVFLLDAGNVQLFTLDINNAPQAQFLKGSLAGSSV